MPVSPPALSYGLSDHSITDPQIEPNGSRIAFCLGSNFTEETQQTRTQIWVEERTSGELTLLTPQTGHYQSPRWARNSRALAILADTSDTGKNLPYVYRFSDKSLKPLFPKVLPSDISVEAVQWIKSDEQLLVLVREPLPGRKAEMVSTLHAIDVKTKTWHRVSPKGVHVWEFDALASGLGAVVLTSESGSESSWYHAELALLASWNLPLRILDTSPSRIGPKPGTRRQIGVPKVSPDGKRVAFLSGMRSDRDAVAGAIYSVDLANGKLEAHGDGDKTTTFYLQWEGSSNSLIALGAADHVPQIERVFITNSPSVQLAQFPFRHLSDPFAPQFSYSSVANVLALTEEGPEEKRKITVLSSEKITNVTLSKPKSVISVNWEGRDKLTLQGRLWLPPGKKGLLPTVVFLHGGPTFSFGDYYLPNQGVIGGLFESFLSLGISIFTPYYRGGTGRGLAFSEFNVKDLGGEDRQDIESGIESIVAKGHADRKRIGLIGWSYGGYLSAHGAIHSAHCRVTVAAAGIYDWTSYQRSTNIPEFVEQFTQIANDGKNVSPSPQNEAKSLTAPILLIQGAHDLCVPPSQAAEFAKHLGELGKTNRYLLLKDSPHGPSKKREIKLAVDEATEWMKKYLLNN